MIRKFSVLYVGQIDLDHVGRDGTPADQRRYPNERIAEAYRSMVDVARVMDDEGYYCLWTAEHHFQREGYEVLPNLILVGTYLAAVTRQLKLGCVTLLALLGSDCPYAAVEIAPFHRGNLLAALRG
jgi:alkanesulfonate monooxygenase SsuD/methylene tetrahydromethanopterin reductase-like flavin-dependent oxidoreductase (luciferase family)